MKDIGPRGVGAGAGDERAARTQGAEFVADAAAGLQGQAGFVDLVQDAVHRVLDGAGHGAVDGGGGGLVFLRTGVGGDAAGRNGAAAQRPEEALVPVCAPRRWVRRRPGRGPRAGRCRRCRHRSRPLLGLQPVLLVPDVLRGRLIRHLQGVVQTSFIEVFLITPPMEPRLVGPCAQLVAGRRRLPRCPSARRGSPGTGSWRLHMSTESANTIYCVYLRMATPYSVAGSLLPGASRGQRCAATALGFRSSPVVVSCLIPSSFEATVPGARVPGGSRRAVAPCCSDTPGSGHGHRMIYRTDGDSIWTTERQLRSLPTHFRCCFASRSSWVPYHLLPPRYDSNRPFDGATYVIHRGQSQDCRLGTVDSLSWPVIPIPSSSGGGPTWHPVSCMPSGWFAMPCIKLADSPAQRRCSLMLPTTTGGSRMVRATYFSWPGGLLTKWGRPLEQRQDSPGAAAASAE